MSATAKLKVEVSALHAGENGHLEISCRATIPAFPMHHQQFADIRTHTVSGKFFITERYQTIFHVYDVVRTLITQYARCQKIE